MKSVAMMNPKFITTAPYVASSRRQMVLIRTAVMLNCILLWTVATVVFAKGGGDDDDIGRSSSTGSNMEELRLNAKPWYLKNLSYGGQTVLPISPATIVLAFLTVFYVLYYWTGTKSYVEASHILLSDPSVETKQRMEGWKGKIGTNYSLFAKYASDHSECPSKRNGGSLGRFRPYDMAPPFDRVCFDPTSKLHTTLGPIQTQFGWHLIYIQDRQIPK
jgi:peptidyl-prolyl cis-trans isomerase C